VLEPLHPIDACATLRLLRFGLDAGATRIDFQAGRPPRFRVGAEARTLRHRQLAGEDIDALLRLFLERTRVPERLRAAPGQGAEQLHFLFELPGEGLFEVDVSRGTAGLAVSVEIIRPLGDPSEIALLET
jgi:hypothetical protein